MKKIVSILAAMLLQVSFVHCQTNTKSLPVLKGPYLGQEPPGNESKIFAPGFISTEFGELNSIFTKNGDEFYFSRRGIPGKPSMIMVSRRINNVWMKPEPVGFTGTFDDFDLFITPDGRSMIFCSNRSRISRGKIKADHDFWISKREGNTWTRPDLFAGEAASPAEDFFPVVTTSGNLYFNSQRGGKGTNDIYCSKIVGGKYQPAELLPAPINTKYREFDAYVSPDESMIIFSSEKPGGFGGPDIYVSYKKSDGKWSEPKNMGNDINSGGSEYGSTLSPDGKYFFYTSNKNGSEDIYWVSAKRFEELKPIEIRNKSKK